MKSPHIQGTLQVTVTSIILALLFGIFTLPQTAVAQGVATDFVPTTIPSGSVVIAMDNTKQGNDGGNCSGPIFNLKAYGLVVRLLHNNIPVSWVIANKTPANRNAADITVNATRYVSGTAPTQACAAADATAGSDKAFAGGPFIILQPNVGAALPIIDAFNAEINDASGPIPATPFMTGNAVQNRVRVYTTTTEELNVPVRYTLTHKPFIAVGPDAAQGGAQIQNFRFRVHERLYDFAKVSPDDCVTVDTNTAIGNEEWGRCNNPGYNGYYAAVPNDLVSSASCFTIATQAHAEDDVIGNRVRYRQFATSGGNLLFQCRSIDIFEQGVDNPLPGPPDILYGLFQTSTGWPTFTDEGTAVTGNEDYPNSWQPFKQFVGNLNPTFGNVGDYDGGTTGANFRPSVIDNDLNYVASVGNIADFSDPNPAVGGHIFELGGHDYFRAGDGTTDAEIPAPNDTSLTIENLNGQRMILNAILVPAQRTGCALAIPEVAGFKQVELTGNAAPTGIISPGDIATWTIRYINAGPVAVTNFQIVDALDGTQTGGTIAGTYVPNTLNVIGNGVGGTLAPENLGYTGVGVAPNTSVLDPLATRTLGANGGMITVTLQTTLTAYSALYLNHPVATGDNIDLGAPGSLKTDTVEFVDNNAQTFGPLNQNVTSCTGPADTEEGPAPAAITGRCYDQNEWNEIATLDPTGIRTSVGPTAAGVFVEGRVIQTGGRGLANATIDLVDLSTGQRMLARSNSFGYFRFDDLEIGRIYTLTPSARRYTFPSGGYTFTLDDNMEGITFVGVLPTKESKPSASKAVESVVAPEVPARKVVRTVVTTRKPGSDR